MKRLFIIIAAACLCAVGAMAQFRAAGVAGVNINSLDFNQDIAPTSSLIGFKAGVMGEMMFPGIGFGIDFGLYYNQAGGKVDLGSKKVWQTLDYGKENARMHYIQIPLHLRFKYTKLSGLEDYVAPFVFGGPEVNILAAHGKCDAFDYSGVSLGAGVGLGAEIMKNWQVYGSYTWGITSACKTKILDDYSAQNRRWTIGVVYFFKH